MFTHANYFARYFHMLSDALPRCQRLTSRLAASCCDTTGGTGTSNARKRGARHHAAVQATWMAAHALMPMQVNERLH